VFLKDINDAVSRSVGLTVNCEDTFRILHFVDIMTR